jgi:hypothetical protein
LPTKLHIKTDLTPISWQQLFDLPSHDPSAVSYLAKAYTWVSDPSLHEQAEFDHRLERTRMLPGHNDIMLDAGVVRRLTADEKPKNTVIMKFVVEAAKNRLRPIRHSKNFNDKFGKETLQQLTVPTRAAVREQVLKGKFAIVVDMTQWFDQLPLDKAVELFFSFDPRDGKGPCCATRVPMGMRHATEIGTSVMRRLLDYEMPANVHVMYVADNVRFIGDADDIVAAFITFAERCSIVGARLNEADVNAVAAEARGTSSRGERKDSAIARGLIRQKYDFLGEQFDHSNNTMCSTQKTQAKFVITWARRTNWTNRQFAAHLGLLYYATSTARISLTNYHSVIRHFARVARTLNEFPERWDAPAERLPWGAQAELQEWTDRVMRNEPMAIPALEPQTCRHVICTDASGIGWAGIHVNLDSGAVQTHAERWPRGHVLQGAHSASTEPQAIRRAICRFLRPADEGAVCILTDHASVVHAVRKGHAMSYDYTKMLETMVFFKCQFFIKHIAGVENPVDLPSRGVGAVDPTTTVPAVMRLFDGAVYIPPQGPFSLPVKGAAPAPR